MPLVRRQTIHRNRESAQSALHRPTQELLAPVHPHHGRQTTERPVRILAADPCAQRGQHRVPGRLMRSDRHPTITLVATSMNHVTHGHTAEPWRAVDTTRR
ncbi:hypothetical protein [Streptomyces sp. ISL-86]|uniref:hypothetical protein n=1 Tax=Streptomyces sp. ISL-86 TaxID=2819187 RepID=UPI001BE5E4E3|nr:hypothetical protein [Streptomyces sp. ISL-86]